MGAGGSAVCTATLGPCRAEIVRRGHPYLSYQLPLSEMGLGPGGDSPGPVPAQVKQAPCTCSLPFWGLSFPTWPLEASPGLQPAAGWSWFRGVDSRRTPRPAEELAGNAPAPSRNKQRLQFPGRADSCGPGRGRKSTRRFSGPPRSLALTTFMARSCCGHKSSSTALPPAGIFRELAGAAGTQGPGSQETGQDQHLLLITGDGGNGQLVPLSRL